MSNRNRSSASAAADAPLDVSTMDPTEGVDLDFSVVKTLEAVPDSQPYLCLLTKMEFGKAGSGFGKLTVECTVQEPAFFADRTITQDFSTQPQSLYRVHNLLVALGEDADKLKEGNFKIVPSNYLGSTLVVVSQNSVYEEQERSRVRRVKHASTFEPWEPSDDPGAVPAEEEAAAF